MPCSTVRFAETYSRKPGELSLPGFCSTRPALRACLSEVLIKLFQKFVGSRGKAPRRGPQAAKLPCTRKRRKGVWGKPSPGVSPRLRLEAVGCALLYGEVCGNL